MAQGMRFSRHLRRFALALCCVAATAHGSPPGTAMRTGAALRLGTTKTPEGRPDVHLDRLDFPDHVAGSRELKSHLERVLGKEVRRVEWGAGRDNRIEYRFSVTKLELAVKGDVVEVSCTARGALPGGRTAKSQLTFSGAANQQRAVIKQVLEIVARGVINRLAQLERRRRGLD